MPSPTLAVIHLVDPAGAELRLLCGAWGDGVAFTTVPAVMSCPACAGLAVAKRVVRAAAVRHGVGGAAAGERASALAR